LPRRHEEGPLTVSSRRPSVSFVIPAYNAAATIRAAVESALAQTYPPLETIVVDDGSTDGTAERVAAFGHSVRVVRSAHEGLGQARWLGHESASGDLVAWLDADDVAWPDRIMAQVAAFQALPEVVLVSSDFRSVHRGEVEPDRRLREYYSSARPLEEIYPGRADLPGRMDEVWWGDIQSELIYGNLVHPPTVTVRRETFLKFAPFPRRLSVAEDWLTILGLARGGPFAFLDRPLIDYHRSGAQMSAADKAAQHARDILAATEAVASDYPELVSRDRVRWRHCLASRNCLMAMAIADGPRRKALSHLLASVRLGGVERDHLRVLRRVMAPRWLVNAFRRARG